MQFLSYTTEVSIFKWLILCTSVKISGLILRSINVIINAMFLIKLRQMQITCSRQFTTVDQSNIHVARNNNNLPFSNL